MKDVDFDQIEDFSTKPIFKTTLVYFTLNQVNFFNSINSAEITTPVNSTSSFLSLKSSFVRNNLSSAEFEFEIENQFNRGFTVNVEFLDDNNNITHFFDTFVISANDLNFKRKEFIYVSGNQNFLSSTKVKVSVVLSPNNSNPINPNIEQKLVFKSAGTFFIKT